MMNRVNIKNLEEIACKAIDEHATELHNLSQQIWQKPELYFEEYEAHRILTEYLTSKGFPVQKSYKTETAFRSDYGSGCPAVALLCEYDALPEIGHACGHNLIAEAGVAASIGVKAALDEAGLGQGKLVVLGTPAEEGGGGKVLLIDEGAFDDVDFALMAHPGSSSYSRPKVLASQQVKVRFRGKASHASGFPWEGVNALDAAVLAYNNVAAMRQQIKPSCRIMGIITNGGTKPNIIPEFTEMDFSIRGENKAELEAMKLKATKCFQGAAEATGCQIELEWDPRPYLDVIHNETLVQTYESHLESLGIAFSTSRLSGSTDMGNVSYTVPGIHPNFGIGTDAKGHTREFTLAAGSLEAQKHTLQTAKVLAMTAIDVMFDPQKSAQMKENFINDKRNR